MTKVWVVMEATGGYDPDECYSIWSSEQGAKGEMERLASYPYIKASRLRMIEVEVA